MTRQEISQCNEALAIQKVRLEYQRSGLLAAMRMWQNFTGASTREAYEKVKEMCEGASP